MRFGCRSLVLRSRGSGFLVLTQARSGFRVRRSRCTDFGFTGIGLWGSGRAEVLGRR